MDPKEEQIRRVIDLFKEQGLMAKPARSGLEQVLARFAVTDDAEARYNYKEVNIISPFYQYMTSTMKVIVSVIVIALLVGGVAYFKLTPNGDGELAATTAESGDLGDLVASLDQEQSEETSLLASGDVESSDLANEVSLLAEINNLNKDEI